MMKPLRLAALVLAAGCLYAGAGASATASSAGTIKACAHFKGHLYEVCFAYRVNCVGAALGPYYSFVHDPDAYEARWWRLHFESRYTGQARRLIEARTRKWPKRQVFNVSLLGFRILRGSSNLRTNTAVLYTREAWVVLKENQDPNADAVFVDRLSIRRITLRRVPGKLLHKWVVSNISYVR